MRISKYIRSTAISSIVFFSVALFATSPEQVLGGLASVFPNINNLQNYDVEISNLDVRKTSKPSAQNMNTVYSFDVTVKNVGEDFVNQQVFLKLEPFNKRVLLAQKDGNFSLKKGQTHKILQKVNVPFYVAEQPISVTLEPYSFKIKGSAPEAKTFLATSDYAGLKNIQISSLNHEGDLSLDWNLPAPSVGEYKYTLLLNQSENSSDLNTTYKEFPGTYYSYGLGQYSQSLLTDYVFSKKEISLEDKKFNLGEDLFNTDIYRILIVEAYNEVLNTKVYSDPIYLYPQILIKRGELAKLIVEKLELDANEEAIIFFNDIDKSSNFYPYVRSLYAAGFTDGIESFRPDDIATRKEVAEIMSLVFDLPFGNIDHRFQDVEDADSYFYSIHSLTTASELKNSYTFSPDEPATIKFINYLLDVLSKEYSVA